MSTFYRITDIAQRTGLSAHTLRYYERIGLIDAVARHNHHRLYNEHDLRWIEFLLHLRGAGMSIITTTAAYILLCLWLCFK